ncbi:MAG: hypothetical protein ABI823_01460 [Bryobacteraceae bacterium]
MSAPTAPSRTRPLLYLLPALVCLAAFYPAFQVWFLRDDFRWLGLRHLMAESATPWATMLAPYAQGTIRVLSERVFFVGLSSLFDMNAFPFHAVVFLTQFASLALAAKLGGKLTGSRAAGIVGACLWAVSPRLAVPMYWTSAYNQILCAFLLLAALACLDRHLETGKSAWLVAQYLLFLLSFGALELGVVYPVIALVWVWMFGRDKWKSTIGLWLIAIAFAVGQLTLIPKSTSPVYQMFFDGRLLTNLGDYIVWAMGPARIGYMVDESLRWYGFAFAGLLIAALGLYAIARRDRAILFCGVWFMAFLAPVLPLANHVSDYYLAIPSLGVCWALGWMLTDFWRLGHTVQPRLWTRGRAMQLIGMLLGACFVIGSVWEIRETIAYYAEQTNRLKAVVQSVQSAHQNGSDKLILLHGVDNDLFGAGFQDDPFYTAGSAKSVNRPLVYLAPGSEEGLSARADLGGISRYVIAPDRAARALDLDQAVVLQVAGPDVIDVTAKYRAIARAQRAAMRRTSADLGDPGSADLLGTGWYPPENGFRWMAKTATLRLSAPQKAGEKIYIDGYVPAGAIAGGPLALTVRVNGAVMGVQVLTKANAMLGIAFLLPPGIAGQKEIAIQLEVSRTFRPPNDARDLGIILSRIAIR